MQALKRFLKLLSPKYQKLILEYKTELKSRYGNGAPPHPELYKIINAKRDIYAQLLTKFLGYKDIFTSIKKCDSKNHSETEPCWNNGYLPGLDIVSLYGMIAEYKPKRYLEIGSGNSTKVAYKAIKDLKLNTFITSVDPYPRASIDQLANKVIRKPLENTDVSLAQELEENDILFIDNSHRVLPNSDVNVCFLEILPRLKRVLLYRYTIFIYLTIILILW